ncbi:hypothetical protein [Acetobacter persici]|uniref:Uncharacterized protein n=1 Tax=Acetobacter persici TaxID=1076596 RepID=A0A1U9LJG2_9PROT|nr:hypothetical protein [Acetobacter persici]AQT06489.1 hypothetical protein A0U91_15880 [Acetobacter persici]
MSTTIYNGFKVNCHSLDDVADLSNDLREQAAAAARLVIAKEVLQRAVRVVDQKVLARGQSYPSLTSKASDDVTTLAKAAQNCRQTLALVEQARSTARIDMPFQLTALPQMLDDLIGITSGLDIDTALNGAKSSPLRHAICSTSSDILEASRSRHRLPALDVEAELWVFREVCSAGCKYYAILHADNSDMYSALSSHPSLIPMPYWNCSDAPDNITREDWLSRGELWKRLLGQAGIPAQNCTSFQICGDYGLSLFSENGALSEPAILYYLPKADLSVEARAEYWARRQWSDRRFHVLSENTDAQPPFSLVFQIIDEAKRADVSLEKNQIAAVLPKITADSLASLPS